MIGLLSAMFIPIGVYAISKTSPYLNLLPALENPETMQLDSMELVDRKYPFSVEKQASLDNTQIEMNYDVWDIKGIFLEEEYSLEERTNYYSPSRTTKVSEKIIDLGDRKLPPNYTYSNEHQQSVLIKRSLEDGHIISQSKDDAWTTNVGTNYTSPTLLLGGDSNDANDNKKRVCLRWSLPIPKGAIIHDAYLNLTIANSSNYDGLYAQIYTFDNTSMAPFSDTDENVYQTRPKTALGYWNFPSSISLNQTIQSNLIFGTDLTTGMQNVIDNSEWTKNSIFGLYLDPFLGVALNEIIEFWSFDAGNTDYMPKLVIDWESPSEYPYTPEEDVSYYQMVNTSYNIEEVIGVWNTSDHSYPNGYNESEGDSFFGNTITLKPAISYTGDLWITYVSDQIPVIVEYYHKPWNSVIWQLGLKVTNPQPDPITVPKANFSLNYLGGKLGNGWISRDYNVLGGEVKTIHAYLETKNTRIFSAFTTAMLTGQPLELKADFEAYILIDGLLGDPMMGVKFPTEIDFPFPESAVGMPPFIWSINRSEVIANQPVTVNVNATDEGTGISNRTYLYYSTDDGASWNEVQMTGGEWVNTYLGNQLADYFPIPSTEQEQTYTGQIPGFSGGTEVLFKVYLEDYAGNIDHNNTGNYIESEIYSYQVPTTGSVPESLRQFSKNFERSFMNEFLDYLEANGVNQFHFLFTKGITQFSTLFFIGNMGKFFYENEIDQHYILDMLILDYERAMSIMADSGVSVGYLIEIYGKTFEELGVNPSFGTREDNLFGELGDISFDILFDYLVDHIFLPTNEEIPSLAEETLGEISVINDFEGDVLANWVLDANGTITNPSGYLGQSASWTTIRPENFTRDFGSEPFSLTENDILTFYLRCNNNTRINENFSLSFIDEDGRIMDSGLLTLEEFTGWDEISLSLNATDFIIDSGFDFGAVQKIQFSYHRDFTETFTPEVSVISCTADENGDLNGTHFFISSPDQIYYVWMNMTEAEEPEWGGGYPGIPVNNISIIDDNITVAEKITAAINAYGGDNPPFTATYDQWNITVTNTKLGDAVLDTKDGLSNPDKNFFPTNFTFYTITDGYAEDVNIGIDHISGYSPRAYESHRYFTDTLSLTNTKIRDFLKYDFNGILGAQPGKDPIIPTSDWDVNETRTSLWNFLDLIATGNDTNNHLTGANLLLEDIGLVRSYRTLVSTVGGEITPLQEIPATGEDIYPYTHTTTMALVYLPLILVTYKVTKNQMIKSGYIEKLKKLRKKR